MCAKRIMVIEDDPQLQQIIRTALEKHGMEVLSIANGTEGEQAIRDQHPDLVIADVMMPGKNGLDLCREAKEDAAVKDIPILMMTCLTEDSERDDEYWKKETGADDFVTKPFPISDLIKRVDALVGPSEAGA